MEQSRAWVQVLRENIGKVLVGKEETIDLVLTTLAAGGHVLLEDVPGTGKTNAGKIVIQISGCGFWTYSVYTGSSAVGHHRTELL